MPIKNNKNGTYIKRYIKTCFEKNERNVFVEKKNIPSCQIWKHSMLLFKRDTHSFTHLYHLPGLCMHLSLQTPYTDLTLKKLWCENKVYICGYLGNNYIINIQKYAKMSTLNQFNFFPNHFQHPGFQMLLEKIRNPADWDWCHLRLHLGWSFTIPWQFYLALLSSLARCPTLFFQTFGTFLKFLLHSAPSHFQSIALPSISKEKRFH